MSERTFEDGFPPDRVKALTDGIFAIVMTLIVLELHVPELVNPTHADLARALAGIWPTVVIYMITFVILGLYWVGHHNFFHFVIRVDRIMLWLNIVFWMLIALLPFSASLLGHYLFEPVAISVYGLHLVIIGIVLALAWYYATRHHHLVDPKMPHVLINEVQRYINKAPVGYSIAVVVSWFHPVVSLILIFGLPVYFVFYNRVYQHLPGRKEHKHDHAHDH